MKFVYYLISMLPIIGIILLKSQYTSADLNDEVTVKQNTLKATTVEIAVQNTIDNAPKNFLFNINNFQKDSLAVASLRIRNIGKEKTKYQIKIKPVENKICMKPDLKIIKDDQTIFNQKIIDLNLNLNELEPNQKNDLVFLLSMSEAGNNIPCNYEIDIGTKFNKHFFDKKNIENEIEISQ